MSTSQVAFYTNRVGKFEKMRRNGQTKPGSDRTNAHLWHIYSHTPTHKLITAHLRCTVTTLLHKRKADTYLKQIVVTATSSLRIIRIFGEPDVFLSRASLPQPQLVAYVRTVCTYTFCQTYVLRNYGVLTSVELSRKCRHEHYRCM